MMPLMLVFWSGRVANGTIEWMDRETKLCVCVANQMQARTFCSPFGLRVRIPPTPPVLPPFWCTPEGLAGGRVGVTGTETQGPIYG
jgi:hypothetical protein